MTPEVHEDQNFEGFNKKVKKNTIYFHIFDNSICRKSKIPVTGPNGELKEGWEGPIETQNPKTKAQVNTWVERYDNLVCRIIDIEQFKIKFDDGGAAAGFNLTLLAGNNKAVLQLNWVEPVLKRLMKVARNINFEHPLYISVFQTSREGKSGIGVSFKQGPANVDPDSWTKVDEFYHRDYNVKLQEQATATGQPVPPEALMPEPIHNEMNDTWDYNAQNNWLGLHFMKDIVPKVKAIGAKYGAQLAAPAQEVAVAAPAVQQPVPVPPVQSQSQQEWSGGSPNLPPVPPLPEFSGGPAPQSNVPDFMSATVDPFSPSTPTAAPGADDIPF
jgi:hypothetical protein